MSLFKSIKEDSMLKRVVITGGVHGNELTGAFLVKKWQKTPLVTKNIKIEYLLGNPKAFKECRRYIDYDLNRSFSKKALSKDSYIYEFERAKVLKERLKSCDFLIDIHTTTANMGMTIVLSKDDPLSNLVAKKLSLEFDDVKILRWFSTSEGDFINSAVPHSITLEAGAICQGVLEPRIFFRCEEIVKRAVEILDSEINQDKFEIGKSVEVYDIVKIVDFPREENEPSAMIHPNILGKDYFQLKNGEPIFVTLEGETILYDGEPLYAVFINEAAYYEKKIAFCLCEKSKI
ncbi:aspartoacylase [Nitrosophilus labii]|uniref:aspartoacylase n=1 Tax=Nitrosophilus labii TaxID=2706014 RepID=UPI0016569CDA|nr:aspartoacylase [Nitrosophilus labii]